jgi:hypothetical protein
MKCILEITKFDWPITLWVYTDPEFRTPGDFEVRYGAQTWKDLSSEEASAHLGDAIMHAAHAAGECDL